MSHIVEIDLHIKDLEALKQACPRLGLEFKENQKKYKWYGRSTGKVPEGWTAAELGSCEHAISVKGNSKSYEVGIAKRRDDQPGYQLLLDFWQGGYGLQDAIGNNGGLLKQAYAIEVAKKQAYRDGFRVIERTLPNGNMVLEAVR